MFIVIFLLKTKIFMYQIMFKLIINKFLLFVSRVYVKKH